jgi:subtilase family serine protease
MERRRAWCAALLAAALSACSSSGGSLPTAQQPASAPVGLANAAAVTAPYPQSAPMGVRLYVHLPLRNSGALDQLIEQQSTRGSALYHHWLTPAQFREQYGPTAQDLQSAAAVLKSDGFQTTITSQGVVADAPQATVERTFGIHLARRVNALSRSHVGLSTLSADRAPVLPSALVKLGAHVAAFAPLPQAQSDAMRVQSQSATPDNRYSAYGGYWFDDLKQAYRYPAVFVADGKGETIAIVAASNYLSSDMATYFHHENVAVPNIELRPVDGGPPAFDPSNTDSEEVTTDIQEAGGSAPGAKLLVYGAPDATVVPSFIDMYAAIVDDNEADVVGTSFGLCELDFTPAYNGGQDFTYLFQDFHDLFRQGNAQGITFLNASGDFGALGCTDPSGTNAIFGVEWPANDPDVTAVGGTNLETTYDPPSLSSAYVSENAYSDPIAPGPGIPNGLIFGSGGGKSTYWRRPLYQFGSGTGSPMRTVPDIAMHMGGCPIIAVMPCAPGRSFDIAVFDGAFLGLIGTSESAQEFTGLQAIQDERLGTRVGNANYLIYLLAAVHGFGRSEIFHDNIPGNNGYPSHPGYNLVVGNGTPKGADYVFDPFGPFAGTPQTPSNP